MFQLAEFAELDASCILKGVRISGFIFQCKLKSCSRNMLSSALILAQVN